MTTLDVRNIEDIRDSMEAFCKRHRISRLAVFGSAVRRELEADSDIDLLYEFEPGYSPGWDIVRIQEEASELFGGRPVDLVPYKYINRHIRKRVLSEAQVLYEAA